MVDYYRDRHFIVNGKQDLTPNTAWITNVLVAHGLQIKDELQKLAGITVYPRTFFCPTTCDSIHNMKSAETVAIHHWAMTWRSEKAKKSFARARRHQKTWYKLLVSLRYFPNRVVRKIFGDNVIDKLKSLIGYHNND